jgi:hypothetical protein
VSVIVFDEVEAQRSTIELDPYFLVFDVESAPATRVLSQDEFLIFDSTPLLETIEVDQDFILLDAEPTTTLAYDDEDSSPVILISSQGPAGPAGPQGPAGESGGNTLLEAGEPLTLASVIYIGADGRAFKASSSDETTAFRVAGVAATSALAGEQVEVASDGVLVTSDTFPLGPLFLSTSGTLTSDPDTGAFQLHVANAVRSTTLLIRLEPAIYH